MSNFTYNPNVNIPYHNNRMDMEYEDKSYGRNYDTPPMLQQIDPRADPREDFRSESRNIKRGDMRETMYEPRYEPRYEPILDNDNQFYKNTIRAQKTYKKPKKVNYDDYEKTDYDVIDKFQDSNSNRFNWMLFGKKILLITALFLIMSSVRMDNIVCNFIPFLSSSQLLCMTVKGIILAIIVIIIQTML
jgi:hypothetical protein